MSDKPNYRRATSVPLTLGLMAATMMRPPKPVLDPVTVAGQKAFEIFKQLKWKVSVCDGNIETVRGLVTAAIERAKAEIVHEATRTKCVEQFTAMLSALEPDAGPPQT